MVPLAVQVSGDTDNALARETHAHLRMIGCEEAWNADLDSEPCDLVFANGPIVANAIAEGLAAAGIEISLPGTDRIDVVPKALLGPDGTLFLLEQILNELHDHVS